MRYARTLSEEEVDGLLASQPARNEKERDEKRRARDRIAAGQEARREDESLQTELERVRKTRDRAVEIIQRYDAAAARAVEILGSDHEVSRLLADARKT